MHICTPFYLCDNIIAYKIKVLETTHSLIGVDTQENLEQVINYIKENNIKI